MMKSKYFKRYNTFLFISILLLTGFLFGLYISKYSNIKDMEYLKYFLTTMNQSVTKYDYYVSQVVGGIVFTLLIVLLGTSIIGSPFISFLIFSKGIQIGFSCALFIYTYQLKGILGILLTVVPQIVFDLPFIYLVSGSAIHLSLFVLYSTMSTHALSLKAYVNSFLNHLLVAFLLILMSSFLKSTVLIELIKLFNFA